jgi:hypothetical protein
MAEKIITLGHQKYLFYCNTDIDEARKIYRRVRNNEELERLLKESEMYLSKKEIRRLIYPGIQILGLTIFIETN